MGLMAPWHVGSSQIRDGTHVSCIGRWILYLSHQGSPCAIFYAEPGSGGQQAGGGAQGDARGGGAAAAGPGAPAVAQMPAAAGRGVLPRAAGPRGEQVRLC